MNDSDGSEIPAIRTFQFESESVANIPKSVNLFRGDVNHSQTLLSLPGRTERPELAVSVSILYGSNVKDVVTHRNLDAPTGVLGVGWELPREGIVVDPAADGPTQSRDYSFQSGGTSSPLIRQPLSDLAPLFTTDAITPADLLGPMISNNLRQVFGSHGFGVSAEGGIAAVDGVSWMLTDSGREQLFLIEQAGAAYAVWDGGESYQLQAFEFWNITYYPVFERWQIRRESGVVSSYGGGAQTMPNGCHTSHGNSVGWNVRWDAWQGSSSVTAGQEQYATAWYLRAMANRWGDEVTYAYNGWPNVAQDIWRRDTNTGLIPVVEQAVGNGTDGLPFTRATYLTEITDVFGRTVGFSYAEKCYSDPVSDPTGPREYADPHKPNASAAGGNAFQDCVETYYLDRLAVRSPNDVLLTTIGFSYLPLANVTTSVGLLQGDTYKRYLGSITQYTPEGLAQPPLRFTYYLQPTDINPGALQTITHPEGATASYSYLTQSLAICNRAQAVSAPGAQGWTPRVFMGPDYVVSLWYNAATGALQLTVFRWIGRWVSWQPAGGPAIYSSSMGLDLDRLQVLANADHFALSFPLMEQGQDHTKLFIYHADVRQPGQWVAIGQSNTDCIDFDTAGSTLTVASGDGFVVAVQQSLMTPSYELWRYTWDWHTRTWLPSAPITGSGNTSSIRLVAQNEYYLLAAYTLGATNTTLSLSYLDPLGIWHDVPPFSDPDFVVNYDTGILLDGGSSFVAAAVETQRSTGQPSYALAIYQWGDDYAISRTFRSTFTEHVVPGHPQTSIAPVVSGDRMVLCSQIVLRFDGQDWLVNETLQIAQPQAASQPAWYAAGEDFVIQTTPSISSGAPPLCNLLTFDPDTDCRSWSTKQPVVPQPPLQYRSVDPRTANFPTAAGADYFTSGNAVYARGYDPDIGDAVRQPIFSIVPTLDTTAMIDQAPDFIAYVVPTDDPTQTTTQVLVLRNGAVATTEYLPGEKYWTAAEQSPNGQYPAGDGCLVTYPSNVSAFAATSTYTVHRFAGDSILAKLTHTPVAAISIDDGFGQLVSAAYAFDTATATCDSTGMVIKYYASTVYPGCQEPSAAAHGRTESSFINGYAADATAYGYMLDGMLAATQSYDASGALVASTRQDWMVFTACNRTPSVPDDVPRALYGGYGRLVSEAATQDGVTTTTTHDYVPDGLDAPFSGLEVASSVALRNATGDEQLFTAQVLRAYDVYPGLAGLQLLTPVAQSTTVVSTAGAPPVPVTSTATTFAAWPMTAADGAVIQVTDVSALYGWRGGAEALFPFDAVPDTGVWLQTNTVAQRNALGLTTETIDACGTRSSIHYDAQGCFALAKFANASISGGEAAYCSFEPEQDIGGWVVGAGATLVGGDSHTGSWSLRLPGGGIGSLAAAFAPTHQEQRYLLSCWVKTPAGFQGDATSGWTMLVTAGGTPVGDPVFIPFADTAGTWACICGNVDLGAYAPADGETLTVGVTATNTSASMVLLDDVVFSPLPALAALSNYDADLGLLLAHTSLDGRTARVFYDPYQRKLGQVRPDESVTDLAIQYASRAGNGDAFNSADPNAIVSLHPRSGSSCELFQSGDAWRQRWSATGSWSTAGGVLTHAAGDVGSLTLAPGAFAPNLAFYMEISPQAALVDPVVVDLGGGTVLSWQPTASSWTLTVAGQPASLLANPSAMGRQILLIAGEQSLTVHVDGQLLFGQTLANAPAAAVTVSVGGNVVALRNLAILRDPIVEVRYHDAAGRPRQIQRLLEQDTLVTQCICDEVGQNIAATKPVPGSFGSGAGAPLLAYRPNVVDLPAFLASLAMSGVMQGDAADYYRGQIEPASGLPRSDDGGYPYSRRRYEASPLARAVEKGAPGAAYSIGGSVPGSTVTYNYAVAVAGDIPTLPPEAADAFTVASSTRPSATGTPGTSVTKHIADRKGNAVLIGTGATAASDDEILGTTVTTYSLTGRQDQRLLPNAFGSAPDESDPAAEIVESCDGLGRLTTRQDPNTALTRALYDGAGKLRFSQVNQEASAPADRSITYHKYDALGRETELGTYPYDWNDTTNAALAAQADVASWPSEGVTVNVSRSYDGNGTTLTAIGQLSRVVRTNSRDGFTIVVEEAFAYDACGKVRQKTMTVTGDSQPYFSSTVSYAYDNLGQLLSIDYPHAELTGLAQVWYTYDRRGRLAQVGESPATRDSIATFAYDAGGRVISRTYGSSGAASSSSFQSPGWPGTMTVTAPGFAAQTQYDFFGDGSLGSESVSFEGGGLTDAYASSYAYDAQRQLIGAANSGHPDWSLADAQYDNNGNMQSVNLGGVAQSYSYVPGTDKLASLDHDQFGHVQETPSLTLAYEAGLGLTSAVSVNDGGPDLAFAYDSQGQRILKRVSASNADTARTFYVHGLSSGPLVEVYADGTAKAFVYTPESLLAVGAGDLYFVVPDHLGSSRYVLDGAGQLAAGFDYLPFGGVARRYGSQPDLLSYLYTGQRLDAETGLYDYRARLYDPMLGRFYAPDPRPSFASAYIYAGNNPIMLVDPTGMSVLGSFFSGVLKAEHFIASNNIFKTAVSYVADVGLIVAGGVVVAGLTAIGAGPAATIIGSTLLGAGIGGLTYNITRSASGGKMSWGDWGAQLGIGAAAGLIAGGVAAGAGAAVDALASGETTSFDIGSIGRVPTNIAAAAVGNGASSFGGQLLNNLATHQSLWSGVGFATVLGAGLGALSGSVGESVAGLLARRYNLLTELVNAPDMNQALANAPAHVQELVQNGGLMRAIRTRPAGWSYVPMTTVNKLIMALPGVAFTGIDAAGDATWDELGWKNRF